MKSIIGGLLTLIFVSVFIILGFSGEKTEKVSFTLTSSAVIGNPERGFDSKLMSVGRIDAKYTAKPGSPANTTSFPFEWKDLPAGTKALALILDDPDAKKVMATYGIKGDAFLHWIAADIDPAMNGLKENASMQAHTFIQGKNGSGTIGYTGPQPPSDIPKDAKKPLIHVYRLKVYALSEPTGLKDGFSLEDLKAAMKGKILGKGKLNFSFSN